MFSQTYLDMLKSTIIKYMDDDKIFAYSPFSNREEQMDLSIAEKKGKVIIFDTRTSYINATQLVDAFKDKPFKEFCKLTKTKNFKDLIDYIEDEINKDPHPNKKFQKYPNWDNKGKYFKALYLVRPSSKNIGYAGTYVHPDLIIHVLVWCNNKLSSKISNLITSILLHEGADETISFDTVLVDELKRYKLKDLDIIQSVIKNLTLFFVEKYKIASDSSGSGNTANIGSIKNIDDILNERGVFADLGEDIFDDYWINYGQIHITDSNGNVKKMTKLKEYLAYRGKQ